MRVEAKIRILIFNYNAGLMIQQIDPIHRTQIHKR